MTSATLPINKKKPPLLRHNIGATITPGDRLGLASNKKTTLLPGKGTYIRQGHLYASILGTLCAAVHHHEEEDNNNNDGEASEGVEKWIISIQPERQQRPSLLPNNNNNSSSYKNNNTTLTPQVGMLVIGRITRVIRPTQAMVDISAIVTEQHTQQQHDTNDQHHHQHQQPFIIPLHEPFSGTLRQNELRPNSSLEINIEDCIRPGDVILARIHANGERDYVLTTAEAELGVIQAVCESSGCEMRAISWKEMECPVSLVREGRKVAKPRQQVRV
ncbi:hypothetical protein ACHAXR_003242 [Thalassiosira sp. AJA248-18]